jgi:hypothetical protein
MKRAPCLFALLVSCAFPGSIKAPAEDLTPRIVAFEKHWEVFVRDYFGCPPHATLFEECVGPRGVINYAEFNKASHAAQELFEWEK